MVLLSSIVFLLIFYLLDLPISVRVELKFPYIIVDPSISACSSTGFCLIYFDSVVKRIYVKDCYVFLEN